MAALVMQVNGFQFQGKIYVALDEGSDYYRIYGEKDGTTKEYHHDIAFDELGDVLDSMIETEGMTKEEYKELCLQPLTSVFGCKVTDSGDPSSAKQLTMHINGIEGNGEATAIWSVIGDDDDDAEIAAKGIYSLSGQKMNATDTRSLPKGIYIVNGKKTIIK